MALDEPKDTDFIVEADGYKLVVERSLLEQVGALSVDFQNEGWRPGFAIRAGEAVGDGGPCGSCTTC